MATATEAKANYVAKMGDELGAQFAQLWQEVAYLYMTWTEYVALFGTKPSRVELLNNSAPAMFRAVQNTMWEATLLNIARLTDPPNSLGRQDKPNLTIQNLPNLIDDPTLKSEIGKLVQTASEKAAFCRDWRNRHIAHRDLNLALDRPVEPLAAASIAQVKEALAAMADVLNGVQGPYMDASTHFDFGFGMGSAISLLSVLDDGLKARVKRQERLSKGQPTEEDLAGHQRDL